MLATKVNDTVITARGADSHPRPAAMAAARTALLDPDNADGVDAARTVRLRAWRNRLTADNEGIQIRLGPDNRWHPYIREGHGTAAAWWPCAPVTADPIAAFVAARTAATRN
ncbi:hypothetical protein ACFU6I_34555 [Streptomyces sp. NPDC057486]|uniref:hypothetical protein n=1 Tax=Streptomyces sp. NPDC057486 TaxID=3346145 RepID=UPI0036789862